MSDPGPMRPRAHLALETTEPTSVGHGFISGLLSALLGIAGFGLVLSLRFPQVLMLDDLRPLCSRLAAGAMMEERQSGLAVDFFVLNLLLYSAVFVPLERFFALRAEQPVFRRQWTVDLTYFFVDTLLIEVLTILTLQPALVFFDWAR